jgi:hypothetical protein
MGPMKKTDEGIEPVRAVRHEISAEFGHDIRKYVEYLRTQEPKYADQIAAYRKAHPKGRRTRVKNRGPAAA